MWDWMTANMWKLIYVLLLLSFFKHMLVGHWPWEKCECCGKKWRDHKRDVLGRKPVEALGFDLLKTRGVLYAALECLENRDRANAGVHCESVRWSPLTLKVRGEFTRVGTEVERTRSASESVESSGQRDQSRA